MASDAAALQAPIEIPTGRWIQSPSFDLFFFILGPLVTLPIVLASLAGVRFIPVLGFVLAFAHYLSTLAFFFWDENQPRHRARWLAFFGGPALITVVFCLLAALRVPLVIQIVIFFWNVVHVARQSCGVLSIYRHRAGIADPRQKRVANAAILSLNLWFCLWNIETHEQVYPVLRFVAPEFARIAWLLTGAVALAMLFRLAAALVRRSTEGQAPGAPEIAILVASVTLFHPFLWLPDSGGATFAMLLPHYLQYLGIVWLLHRRKFPVPVGSRPQVLLQQLSASSPLLVATLGSVAFALLAGKLALGRLGQAELFEDFYLLVALVHFYLDGLFWAFKDPHVRKSMGPYLVGGGAPAPALAVAR